jgi:hypothetical protein
VSLHLALGGRGTLERVFGLAVDSVISAKVCVCAFVHLCLNMAPLQQYNNTINYLQHRNPVLVA